MLHSILFRLARSASERPTALAYSFLDDQGNTSESLTFGELYGEVRRVAEALRRETHPGDRVLLAYPPGLEFVVAFLACSLARVTPVPAHPPHPRRRATLDAIVDDCRPVLVATCGQGAQRARAFIDGSPLLRDRPCLITDSELGVSPLDEPLDPAWIEPSDLALLQYTSGSTGNPKGVMVRQDQLLHNEAMMHDAFGIRPDSTIVSWLPVYHDMGLIGSVLQPLYAGVHCVLLSPVAFLQKPWLWLRAISDFKGTTSGGPNFAYDLCVEKITAEHKRGLDLSSWTLAFSGAEPVRDATLRRFAEAFGDCGFRADAFYPCYGLAEATLFVSGGTPGAGFVSHDFDAAELEQNRASRVEDGTSKDEAAGRKLVACGRAWLGQEIRIVDPETLRTSSDGTVGEIWVHGPSIAEGYWNQPEQTERDFQARPVDAPEAGPFLRTGDLGFVLDGRLYVSGRLKDLIILRGRNLYPQDIERTAERCHGAFRSASSAAFAVEPADDSGAESLVLVMETERDSLPKTPEKIEALATSVRSAVALEQQVGVDRIVFLRPGAVPKTSSGKIRRRATREALLEGRLKIVGESLIGSETSASEGPPAAQGDPGAGDLEAVELPSRETLAALPPEARHELLLGALVSTAARRLGIPESGLAQRSLTEIGLDSLAAVELIGALQEAWGTHLEPVDLLAGTTLDEAVRQSLETPAGGAEAIARRPRPEAPIALSYGQEALWFLQDLAPESAAYHISAAAGLKGELEVGAMSRAFDRLIARHPALATVFVESPELEGVHQVLSCPGRGHADEDSSLAVIDAEGWSSAQVFEYLAAEAHRPFDLRRRSPLRARLLRRGTKDGDPEHVLLLVLHHMVGDFWSLTVMLQELGVLYRSEVDGAADGLPLPEVDYGDFVLHQRRLMEGPEGERLEAFWRAALDGPMEPLELPTDRPRPSRQTFDGGVVTGTLPAPLGRLLQQAAQDSGSTLFTVLLAGFQAVLHRLSGQEKLFVGSPQAGRADRGLQHAVGYFVNPVVLGSEMSADTTWRRHLENTRNKVFDALRHGDLPFELLVRRLQPERSPGRSPIFQVMFTHQQPPRSGDRDLTAFALGHEGSEIALGGLRWRNLPIAERAAQMDLSLTTGASADGSVALKLSYNSDLFDADTARGFLTLLADQFEAACRRPDQPLAELELVSDRRRDWLRRGNETDTAWPDADLDLFSLFRRRADERPSDPALTFDGAGTTYRELRDEALVLAGRLSNAGARAERPVALYLDRSREMVIGLLGILASGAAYVPLDPDHPEERLGLVLEDLFADPSARPLILTRAADRARLDALLAYLGDRLPEVTVLEVDAEPSESKPPSFESGQVGGHSLAYTIFTSGSTGRPKGVQISHRAAGNFLRSMAETLGVRGGESLLAVTTLSFDISLLEIFLPLVTGGRVVLADRQSTGDGRRLSRLLDREKIDILQATPATWRLLVDSGWTGRSGLTMLCGGEALPAELAASLLPRGRQLWNVYGPTETTVWSAARRLTTAETPVRIGGALSNTRIYVLDDALRPVPDGVAGELWIAGDGLARGYLRRPALTAESFVPDPFAAEVGAPEGGRLYRVRDRVRRRADGTLEFLGRTDHQVKVRGYRMELGEIEQALCRHEGVRQAVVCVDRPKPGDPASDRLVAFVLYQDPAAGVPSAELKSFVRALLPDYMVPSVYAAVDAWPLTPNGKIDRLELGRRAASVSARSGSKAPSTRLPRNQLEQKVAALWCEVLGLDAVGLDDNFFDLGGHSLLASRLHARLREELPGTETLTLVELFQYPTVGTLATRLAGEVDGAALADPDRGGRALESGDVAIVGMAGRFPGAQSVDELWRLLQNGEEAITFFTDDQLEGRVPEQTLQDPSYVKARGVLADADAFDAGFFGFTPREAEVMDPQHRLFLECAWHALEDAGIDPRRADTDGRRTALFAGAGMNTYLLEVGEQRLSQAAGGYQAFISNDKDFVPTRVSYKLDLRGPSVNVQTACSSSLVAVALACKTLLAGEADMALAGGVTVRFPQEQGYLHEPGGILSPDGRCRAFDADAGGTVLGSGLGLVVLKPLEKAQADGDRIHAVIKGAAINNDGSLKMGYTAPSLDGQTAVIREALQKSGVEPSTVGYVEAHGTGTAIGDPIEMAALNQAYGSEPRGDDRPPVWIGSIKSNIGHLDTAAGIAGLIKAVLTVREGRIPPTLHYKKPNPKLHLGPFRPADRLVDWPDGDGTPRRAAVSSFGIGGTNAHLVLEQAPAEPRVETPGDEPRSPQLLILSAQSRDALDEGSRRLAEALKGETDRLADVAHTLQVGRHALDHRRWLIADDADEAATALAELDPSKVTTGKPAKVGKGLQGRGRPVVFLFSGQGSQYLEMASDLYASEPFFRAEADRYAETLEPELGFDVRRFLSPPEEARDLDDLLRQTRFTQPALFVVELALARWWRRLGVEPEAMLGHSIGELVAATVAGVFQEADALRLVALRGRLMQEQPPGSMLAVNRSERDLEPWTAEGLAVAAVNGPTDLVLSGPHELVDEAQEALERDGASCRRLVTSHAFHSSMMEPAVEPFVAAVAACERSAPALPFLSNVSGDWITPEQAVDPEYWGRHLVAAVRFADGIERLAEAPRVFLEVGPGRVLATLGKQLAKQHPFVPCLPHPKEKADERLCRLRALGRLWQEGVEPDWSLVDEAVRPSRRPVSLPGYAFERRRHFLPSSKGVELAPAAGPAVDPLRAESDADRWLYAPVWSQAAPPEPVPVDAAETWLVYTGRRSWGERLATVIDEWAPRRTVIHVQATGSETSAGASGAYTESFTGAYTVHPDDPESWIHLLGKLDATPDRVVYAPSIAEPEEGGPGEGVDDDSTEILRHLVALLDGLTRQADNMPAVPVDVVTFGAHRLAGCSGGSPRSAMPAAFLRALERELPQLTRRVVDLPSLGTLNDDEQEDLWLDLAAELAFPAPAGFSEVALRHGVRWTLGFERLPETPSAEPRDAAALGELLDPEQAVVITGGFGGIGLSFAGALVDAGIHNIALLGRRLPSDTRAPGDGELAQRLDELRSRGAEIQALAADVTDPAAVAEALQQVRDRLGPIGGVIHAAGNAGGGLWNSRDAQSLRAVLAPKVEGTEILWRHVRADEPAFFVLCSSINAVVGGFGQSDYCAANAFQNAFAGRHDRRRGTRVLSLAWDRWRGVGMAGALGGGHPLLGLPLPTSGGRRIYRRNLTADPALGETAWVLSEHLIAGRPTVPGAAYVEMARAAYAETALAEGDEGGERPDSALELPVEMAEITFLVPLSTHDGVSRETLTVLEPVAAGASQRAFRILSRPLGRSEEPWQEHCRGTVGGFEPRPEDHGDEAQDLDILRMRLPDAIAEGELRRKLDRGFLETGERWQALTEIFLQRGDQGADELLARLSLPQSVRGDVLSYGLHPSLLDIGTGCMQLARDGDFLPLVYERLRFFAPLPAELWSHLRMRPSAEGDEVIHCDLDLLDDHGRLLAGIEGFAMRRIHSQVAEGLRRGTDEPTPAGHGKAAPSAIADAAAVLEGPIDEAGAHRVLTRALRLGRPSRAGGRRGPAAAPWLVVSPRPLDAVRELYARFDPTVVAAEIAESLAQGAAKQERPELDTDYVAPAGGLEGQIADVWKTFLGIDRIGAHDNFFDLGGTSLLGVQVIGELKKRLQRDIPTVSLFEAPTVASMAKYLAPKEADAGPAFAATRSRADRKKSALKNRPQARAASRAPEPSDRGPSKPAGPRRARPGRSAGKRRPQRSKP